MKGWLVSKIYKASPSKI